MKARIDTKEFVEGLKQAARWSTKTGAEASECVWLRANRPWLTFRTTTLDQDCILAVNNFGSEDGEVLTKVDALVKVAIDTGAFVNVSTSGSNLVLEYEDFGTFEIGTVSDDVMNFFPVLMDEVTPLASINRDTLIAAAAHTIPIEKSGLPIKSAVHLIPNGGQIAVVGSEGTIGYMQQVSGTIETPLSIGAKTLVSALMSIKGMVEIGTGDYRIQIRDLNSPSRIQFASMQCPSPANFVGMFNYGTTGSVSVPGTEIDKLRMLCSGPSAIDSTAGVKVSVDKVEVLGHEVSAEMDWDGGDILTSFFIAENLAQALGGLRSVEEYTISTVEHKSGNAQLWYVDGIGRHFIMCAAPARFSEDSK